MVEANRLRIFWNSSLEAKTKPFLKKIINNVFLAHCGVKSGFLKSGLHIIKNDRSREGEENKYTNWIQSELQQILCSGRIKINLEPQLS